MLRPVVGGVTIRRLEVRRNEGEPRQLIREERVVSEQDKVRLCRTKYKNSIIRHDTGVTGPLTQGPLTQGPRDPESGRPFPRPDTSCLCARLMLIGAGRTILLCNRAYVVRSVCWTTLLPLTRRCRTPMWC